MSTVHLPTKCGDCGCWVDRTSQTVHRTHGCDVNYLDDYQYDGTPLAPHEEKQMIKDIWAFGRPVVGQAFYVLSFRWFTLWKEYTCFDDDEQRSLSTSQSGMRPPPIDNSDLLRVPRQRERDAAGAQDAALDGEEASASPAEGAAEGAASPAPADEEEEEEEEEEEAVIDDKGDTNARLRDGIAENYDYIIVPLRVYQRLLQWYGGGPGIMRRAIRYGYLFTPDRVRVDLFPICITVTSDGGATGAMSSMENSTYKWTECASSLWREIRTRVSSFGSHPLARTLMIPAKTGIPIGADSMYNSLEATGFTRDFVLQVVTEGQAGNLVDRGTGYGGGYRYVYKPPANVAGDPIQRGIVGLHNLGNTCFMNSALQCLFQAAPLVNLFLSGIFKEHVNKKNRHGSKGAISDHFRNLLADVWSGSFIKITPAAFRTPFVARAAQFSGREQHDAQELLNAITVELHEDLKEPTEGPPDLVNEESPVRALIGGVYKSTLVCQECNGQTVTREPFTSLQLSVPEKENRLFKVLFFPANAPAIRYGVRVYSEGTIDMLLQQLSEVANIGDRGRLAVLQIMRWTTFGLVAASRLCMLRDEDRIHVYELDAPIGDKRTFVVQCKGQNSFGRVENLEVPFVIAPPAECTYDDVHQAVCNGIISMCGSIPDEYTLYFGGGKKSAMGTRGGGGGVGGAPQEVPRGDELAVFPVDTTFEIRFASHAGPDGVAAAAKLVQTHPSCDKTAADAPLTTDVQRCFADFGAAEVLRGANAYQCAQCSGKRTATKTLTVVKAPVLLVSHLRRFNNAGEKISTLVEFGERLGCPFPHLEDGSSPDYTLFGVVNHDGSLGGGHYTAVARSAVNDLWYSLNDASAKEMGDQKMVTSSAYLLFYIRTDRDHEEIPDVYAFSALVEEAAEAAEQHAKKADSLEFSGPENSPASPGAAKLAASTAAAGAAGAHGRTAQEDVLDVVRNHRGRDFKSYQVDHALEAAIKRSRLETGPPVQQPQQQEEEEPSLNESVFICERCSTPLRNFDLLAKHLMDVHDDPSFLTE